MDLDIRFGRFSDLLNRLEHLSRESLEAPGFGEELPALEKAAVETYASISPSHIRINFAEAQRREGGVVLTPEDAAGLALLLLDQLRRYENEFGPIQDPNWAASRKLDAEKSRPNEPSL